MHRIVDQVLGLLSLLCIRSLISSSVWVMQLAHRSGSRGPARLSPHSSLHRFASNSAPVEARVVHLNAVLLASAVQPARQVDPRMVLLWRCFICGWFLFSRPLVVYLVGPLLFNSSEVKNFVQNVLKNRPGLALRPVSPQEVRSAVLSSEGLCLLLVKFHLRSSFDERCCRLTQSFNLSVLDVLLPWLVTQHRNVFSWPLSTLNLVVRAKSGVRRFLKRKGGYLSLS
jgi:hypothetical protein